MTSTQENLKKDKILYLYDPLCGWCYGFTPVMQLLSKKYESKFDFDVICRKASSSPATGFAKQHIEEQTAIVEEPKTFYTTKDKKLETILQSAEVAYVWSPYDAYEAADILSDVLENHKKNTN